MDVTERIVGRDGRNGQYSKDLPLGCDLKWFGIAPGVREQKPSLFYQTVSIREGNKIRVAIKKQFRTQAIFAEKIGCSIGALNGVCRVNASFTKKLMTKIVNALNLELECLK